MHLRQAWSTTKQVPTDMFGITSVNDACGVFLSMCMHEVVGERMGQTEKSCRCVSELIKRYGRHARMRMREKRSNSARISCCKLESVISYIPTNQISVRGRTIYHAERLTASTSSSKFRAVTSSDYLLYVPYPAAILYRVPQERCLGRPRVLTGSRGRISTPRLPNMSPRSQKTSTMFKFDSLIAEKSGRCPFILDS